MIPVFQILSHKIGRYRVILGYDIIIFTNRYDPAYHLEAFGQIAKELRGYTSKCVISFVDIYTKNKKNMKALNAYFLTENDLVTFGREIALIAGDHDIQVATCTETIDLSPCGIQHNCCIDKELIEKIIGCKIRADKDKNQRKECDCVESIGVGTYNTYKNGGQYCYANDSPESVSQNGKQYDAYVPLLCGSVTENDEITERKVRSLKEK